MKGQEKFDKFVNRYPHSHQFFFDRPFLTRRSFFNMLGAGVSGFFLNGNAFSQNTGVVARGNPKLISKAKNVIFILLTGAPSHTDTFDLKVVNGVTPSSFGADTINGVLFPAGLMPKLATALPDMTILRSMRSWALQHNLAQAWAQIERSPAAALGDIAPHFGSIISAEKVGERRPTDTFPTFLALNANDAVGAGYLPSAYSPIKFSPQTVGFPDTTNVDGVSRFNNKWDLLHKLDGSLRTNSPLGEEANDMEGFYQAGKGMMFNSKVDAAFRYTTAESQKYGNSGFGNACLTAYKVLAQDAGTRAIHISFGSWDHHQNIYEATVLPRMTTQLDNGLGTLLADLKSSGLLNDTLVVMMGEFGRTVGRLTGQMGRDHYLQQFAVFAGAGVKGGRALGSTSESGGQTAEWGWGRERDFRTEDVGATIYSAMGINYTNIRYDDPFRRGLEYIPYADQDLYAPIEELWKG